MFTEALNEPMIQQAVKELVKQGQALTVSVPPAVNTASVDLLEQKIQTLEQALQQKEKEQEIKLQQVQAEKNQLNSMLQQEKAENEHMSQQLKLCEQQVQQQQQQISQQSIELNRYHMNFGNVLAAYEQFQQLNASTKTALNNILKAETLETFIYCGVQYENIDPLWEAMKREIVEGRTMQFEQLDALFIFFLQAHNTIYSTPLFVRNQVVPGEMLDEDIHIRTATSSIRGPIQQVYFAGYTNAKTNKIVKKSVVFV